MSETPSKPRSPFRLDPYLLLTVAISAVAAVPLLGPYFVGSHDGVLAVYRFFEFDRSIQDGILLPRWAPDLFFGYGYPFFNFYAPLSYYVAEVFHHLGAGFVGSISGAFALGFVLSGLFMYLLVRDLAGRWAGVLAGLAYVFAPYHLVNAHLRGDLAEFFAFVWFPAILWAAGRLIARRNLGYLALTAVLYAALLLTHNIMALAFSPLLAAYMIFLLLRERKAPELARRAAFGLLAVALAFGLSAFFWVPALQQIGEIQIGRLANDPSFYFRSSLMQISGYVSDAILQDYGPRSAGGDYGYPVELGLLQVMMAVAAVRLMAWRWRRGERAGVAPFGFLAVAALAYYAVMFPWSLFLWEKLPLMSYLQSPWRLLPFLILFTSVLIGYLGGWAARLRPAWAGATLLLLALLVTVPNVVNLQPRYVDLQESDVTVNGTIRFEMMSQDLGMTAAGEYLPKGVRSKLTGSPLALDAVSQSQPPTPFDPGVLAKGAQAEVLETRTTLARFRVQSPEGTAFLFNQTYFPGWEAYTDGQPATIRGIGSANLMALDVPGGQHDLEFRFQDTRSRILGEAVSLASLVGVIAILALTVRRRSQSHHGDVQGETVPATRHNRAQPDTTGHHHPRPAANRLALAGLVAVLATSAAFLAPRLNPPSSSVASFPVNATWSSGPTLLGYDLSSTTLIPGQSLDLTLHWGERPQGQDTRVEIKGHTGQVWAQSLAKSDSAGDATN
ncbi:MAG: 6-pyruvoyl-tetrahydropterin synthase-related protein, partial [Dehalococcoidia bacterium]|nr:6-pyruvoyl-tetrahydropterin synthase-related protein [Dehalococcoidia bacterium]